MAQDSENSSYRERMVEHLLIGEMLKFSWANHGYTLEVARPEVDNSGYDLILEANKVVRHCQIKSSFRGASTANQKVHVGLEGKPSGCILWIEFDKDSLELGPFHFFGQKPGMPIGSLGSYKTAKHTKGNKDGVKAERPNIKVIPKGKFTKINSIVEMCNLLFGPA
jgi:hypothetical protein